jgi:hypothetical protein
MLDALVAVDLIERQMNDHFERDGTRNASKRRGGAKQRQTRAPSEPTEGRSARRAGLVVRRTNRLRLG